MSKLKSIFLKITLISAICLLASFSFVIANKETNTKPQLNATPKSVETVSVQNQKEDNALVLNWTKAPQPTTEEFSLKNNVSLMSNTETNNEFYEFVFPTDFASAQIVGGTTIKLNAANANKSEQTITVSIPAGPNVGTYTITAKTKAGYEFTNFYFANESNKNTTDKMTAEVNREYTTEEIDPNYTGKLYFSASTSVVNYKLKLHYSYDYKNSYIEQREVIYNVNSDTGIYTTSADEGLNNGGKYFGCWMIRSGNLADKSSTYTSDSQTLIVKNGTWGTDGAYFLEFKISKAVTAGVANISDQGIYYVESVTGWGECSDVLVEAKWSNTYNLKITNKGTTTKGFANKYWGMLGQTDLFGAYSKNENESVEYVADAHNVTQFEIRHNDRFAYPFMHSDGMKRDAPPTSFFKKSDFDGTETTYGAADDEGWYYVYNYGFYITDWKIYFTYNSTPYYLSLMNTPDGLDYYWNISTIEKTNTISSLTNQTLANLSYYAETIDNYFGTNINDLPTLEMEPIWEPVEIEILYTLSDVQKSANITFADSYTLDKPNSLLCYSTSGDEPNVMIAQSAYWAYTTIPSTKYTYEGYDYGKCKIDLYPIYLENLIRVDLKDDANSIGKFKNDSNIVLNSSKTDYSFTTSNLSASSIDYSNYMFVYDKFGETSTFMGYTDFEKEYAIDSNTIVDEYSNYLSLFKTSYENSIINGTNNCLRKVFYGGGTTEGTSISSDGVSALWIYLADGQLYGNLPVFTTADEQQLIMWHNAHNNATETSKHYVYTTSAYNEAEHEEEIYNENGTLKDEYLIRTDGQWFTSDGNANTHCLKAHFYRKNYLLDVNTVYNKLGVGLYGYVIVSIDDVYDLKEGNFLVADTNNDKTIEIYDIGTYQAGQIKNLLTTKDEDHTLIVTKDGKKYIQLFADCAVSFEVYDQSKAYDSFAGTTAFDNMIGYRYSGLTQIASKKGELELFDTVSYEDTVGVDSIKGLGLANGEIITLDFNFEPIKYELTIKVGNTTQSEFDLKYNGTVTRGYKEYTINNLTVDSQAKYEILTHIFAGYKLQEKAFTLDNGETLQKYVDSGDYIQDYSLKKDKSYFYGDWLKTYLYINDSDWTVDDKNLGTITINTGVIDFNFGLKLYDSYSEEILNPTNTITCVGNCDEDCECNSKIDLVSSNKTPIINLYTTDTTEVKNYFCYYDHDDNTETENRYALLSSRMFFPKDYLTQKNNHYKTYNFLLKNGQISQYTITSDLIKKMVNNYDNGKIIKVEDRNLYMLLEVSPIIEIILQAKDLNDNEKEIDTNSTTRTVKISNGNGNNAGITLSAGSEFNESTSILSYKGLENKLTFSFDEKRYVGVECYINGSLITDATYNFAENKTISIKFVPKPLEINIVYKDTTGNVVSREAMNSYIDAETLPTTPGKYYINNSFFYSVTAKHSDYDLSVTINGNYIGSTKGSDGRKLECSYIVKDPDFDYEKLEIEVKIIEKDNQSINIRFELKDSSQSELSDIYGSIMVEDNYSLLASGTNLTKTDYLSFNVYQERTVTVEFDLHLGYYAVEYRQNANEPVSLSGLGNRFVMIQSFDPNVHYGDWYIVIEKYKFDVELDTTNKIGEYTINGREYLSDMYVGKTIDFGVEEKDGERFEYFYYLDKANNEVPIVEYNTDGITPKLDENGNKIPLNSIQITNDMLTKVFGNDIGDKIKFSVKTIVQYKLDYIVSGKEYAENIEIKLGEDEYLSGTYVDVGTVLSLNITTIVPTKYNIEIKDIILNTTENVDELARTLTLNKNENLQIKIYPKTYTSTIEENVYETLEQIGNKTPVEVTTNKVNNAENKALYDQNAIITIVRVASDRELAELFVTDEKGTYVIIFDGREYKVYNVVSGVVDYSTEINLAERENPYVLSVNNNTIGLQFVTKDALSIVANYKLYKSISTS